MLLSFLLLRLLLLLLLLLFFFFFFFFFHVIYTVNHLKNVLVVRGELVTGLQVQFWSPILTHSKSSSQRSWPWMTAVAGAVGQGEKKKTLPLVHLPLCATNSRSPNLLQNFLNVARSYCSEKLILKLNQNDGNFSFFYKTNVAGKVLCNAI